MLEDNTVDIWTGVDTGVAPGPAPLRVVLVGNFPPRRCGIATFTGDLYDALKMADPKIKCEVVAMTDKGRDYDYPAPVKFAVRQNMLVDYVEAARRLNRDGVGLVCLQHEFGIFGGPAGEHVLTLLGNLRCPVVTTLHTVLADPDPDQRRVLNAIIERSSRVIVMAEKGREILTEVYGAPAVKIAVIPHGAHERPKAAGPACKEKLGFAGRDVLLTFGLLSPSKGLETMVRAMPAIVAAKPEALYVILGATHPNLVAREGEAYRERLLALTRELDVEDNIRFVNTYVDTPLLLDYLTAADVYVTPYLSEGQITSGTLSFAVGLGKAVLSTPFWHARELLADGRGVLAPFGDSGAFAHEAISLLTDRQRRTSIEARAYETGRGTLWRAIGERYLAAFSAGENVVRLQKRERPELVKPDLGAVRRLTDDCGIIQHGLMRIPDRSHGYCIDDNARALILMHRLRQLDDLADERLTGTYTAFLHHSWNPARNTFRNFMSYERRWLEEEGSSDSCGRAFWALGETAALARESDVRAWAAGMAEQALPHMRRHGALRTSAFVIFGLTALLNVRPRFDAARERLGELAHELRRALMRNRTENWVWYEALLAYDNARLPEAVLRAGHMLEDTALIEAGLDSLSWVCQAQTAPAGHFRPVGTDNFGKPYAIAACFDQQPLEATATIDACAAAFAAGGDKQWLAEARKAYEWFHGANDLAAPLRDAEGGCHDGLTPAGPNLNQGAESVLSFQLATCAMHMLSRAARDTADAVPQKQTTGARL
ncbi:MAG TPA: glycosyltransferase family 4 protein [Caulobacterales bacterium]|nr:glycosyltransferase family 4 protein [Caulobacterales bacterium]